MRRAMRRELWEGGTDTDTLPGALLILGITDAS